MARYLVTWKIDEFAESPELAARAAWRHMRSPGSIANVFTVIDETGNQTKVDLLEIAEERSQHVAGEFLFLDIEDRSGECA